MSESSKDLQEEHGAKRKACRTLLLHKLVLSEAAGRGGQSLWTRNVMLCVTCCVRVMLWWVVVVVNSYYIM